MRASNSELRFIAACSAGTAESTTFVTPSVDESAWRRTLSVWFTASKKKGRAASRMTATDDVAVQYMAPKTTSTINHRQSAAHNVIAELSSIPVCDRFPRSDCDSASYCAVLLDAPKGCVRHLPPKGDWKASTRASNGCWSAILNGWAGGAPPRQREGDVESSQLMGLLLRKSGFC